MANGRIAMTLFIVLLTSSVASAAHMPPKWRAVAKVPGVLDVVGPRGDGRLVLATHGGLFLMRPGGSPLPYARGPRGYPGSPGRAVHRPRDGPPVPGVGRAFGRDVVFALDPDATPGIVRVDRSGRSSRFADLPSGRPQPASPSTPLVASVIAFWLRRSQRARRHSTHSIAAAEPGP